MVFNSKKFLGSLTSRPGVYCMKNTSDKIIYVGKAKNLKKRVSSYFNNIDAQPIKNQVMAKQICNINITVTQTENEALVLENRIIKKYKPKYNIIFRDDKSYPYIFLSTNHDYPRFLYHRGSLKGEGKYFGPFPSAGAVKKTLNIIQKLFLIRSCEDSVFSNRSRPCLQHQIKRCSAPCVNYISKNDYENDIKNARLFIEGKKEKIIKELSEPMQSAADKLDFEKAAKLRDQIRSIREIQEKQFIGGENDNFDIVVCVKNNNCTLIHLSFIRSGLNLGSRKYYPHNTEEQTESDLIEAFLGHFYVTSMSISFLLIVCYEVLLLEWRVNKVKKGEIDNLMPISIEKNYNYAFKLVGLGMIFLTLALISGILITEILTINIQLKALFTFISWLIYFVILIGMTFFNLKIKYAVRGLVFTLVFVLVAYMGNAFIFSTIT